MRSPLLFCLTVALFVSCKDIDSIKNQHRDVAYALDSEAQKLDIFIPAGKGPFPAVILIHSGSFRAGDKKMAYPKALRLVKQGYVAIPVNYRLSGEATFPAAVHDCKAAIRFVRAHADAYKVQADKIACWGTSAGGNLAAMMATSAGDSLMAGTVGQHLAESTSVQATVIWYAPINLGTLAEQAQQLKLGEKFEATMATEYLGVEVGDHAHTALIATADPTSYLDPNDPPFLVQVGDKDAVIPYLQSQAFASALKQTLPSNQVIYTELAGAGHGGKPFGNDANFRRVINFLDEHLKQE